MPVMWLSGACGLLQQALIVHPLVVVGWHCTHSHDVTLQQSVWIASSYKGFVYVSLVCLLRVIKNTSIYQIVADDGAVFTIGEMIRFEAEVSDAEQRQNT